MGSRTPTSGTGRDEFAREGAKGIKGGTDATFRGFTTVAPSVCVFVQKWQIRRCFPSATGVGGPVKEVRVGWRRRPEGTPTIRCGGSRLPTRGSTTLRFGGSDIATLSSSPRILPESQTSRRRRTALDRGLQLQGTVKYLVRSHSASLSLSTILASFFFNIVFVIGPEVTSPRKTSRQVHATFYVTFLHRGFVFLF
jgi:hypothetical protein